MQRFIATLILAATVDSLAHRACADDASTIAPQRVSVTEADLDAIWKDPTFQKQFIGGYGVNAEIEPRVTKEEVALLEKIRPLMADDLPKAEEMLRKAIGEAVVPGKVETSKASSSKASSRKPVKAEPSAILDFTLGGALFQQDRLDDALVCFKNAVAKFPSFRRAYRNIGLISVRKSDFPAAITAFNRMIELGGADAYSYGLLGFSHSSKQDYQPAEAAYRNALLLQPDNLEWRLGLTRCVFRQGKFEDAAALLDVLIETYPDKAEFWMLQAHTFLGMKQPLKAAMNLEAMDALGNSTLDSLSTLGDIYLSENVLDLSLSAYLRLIALDATQPVARGLRSAELLASRGGGAHARTLITAMKSAQGEALAATDKGKLLKLEARLAIADGGGDDATAAVLEEIIQLDPLDGEALMLLASHYSRADAPDRAILCYERAAGIESFAANAKVRHAQILVGQSRFADAIALLRQAQELKPREDVARYLEQVERVAKNRLS